MKQFYTCWVEGTSGGYGSKHTTFVSAKTESERLANLAENKGKTVYVLCCLGYTKVVTTVWENCEIDETDETDEMPF